MLPFASTSVISFVDIIISEDDIGVKGDMGGVGKKRNRRGLYQGIWGATNAVFFSLLVSFFLSVVLLILKRVTKKDVISFAPSILLGTVISILLSGY